MNASTSPELFSLPEKIGQFRVLSLLGSGACANVYLAFDPDLSRHVAIKVPSSPDECSTPRFLDEARKTASLGSHPGIVTVHNFGQWHDQKLAPCAVPYVVMEFVPGGSLLDLVNREQLPHDRVAEIMTLVAEAVHHAHSHGLLHRDLKPGNILLDEHGRPRVADFGLAAHLGGQHWDHAGTRAYMSPEQVLQGSLDGRTDIWSLGVILYLLLVGRLPFDPADDRLSAAILRAEPIPPSQYDDSISNRFQAICLKCLARNPRDRYSTARELAEALRPLGNRPRLSCLHRRATLHFTGRAKILGNLYRLLRSRRVVALTGLGGVGKTQIALRYADLNSHRYDGIFWANAASHKTILSDFREIAVHLHLAHHDDSNHAQVLESVLNWLQHEKSQRNWLLILDNADDLLHARRFIPSTSHGHVLITTRQSTTGDIASAIVVENFTTTEATLYLLRRAKRIPSDAFLKNASMDDRRVARKLVKEFRALPLALLQAGAYIEETNCSLSEYLALYKTSAQKLLAEQGDYACDYPDSVATTWLPSFRKTEESCPAAADILRYCAFLSPDSIPEEIILLGAPHLGQHVRDAALDPFQFHQAIKHACRFSLLSRNRGGKTFDMHQLVQKVLQHQLGADGRREWAERTVRAVSRAFPVVDSAAWALCDRLLPHALAAAVLPTQYEFALPEAAGLLGRIGAYLTARGQYDDAEQMFQQSLERQRRNDDLANDEIAAVLTQFGWLYRMRGNYCQAERVLLEALQIRENKLSSEDRALAETLNNLAVTYANSGKTSDAEPLYRRALKIRKSCLGSDHFLVAGSLNNLGSLCNDQCKFDESETLYREALAIKEAALGEDHPSIALTLNNLSDLYLCQGRYQQAEPVTQRACQIRQAKLPPSHPYVVWSQLNLAIIYHATGNSIEADEIYDRVQKTVAKTTIEPHRGVARALRKLADIYGANGELQKRHWLANWADNIRSSVEGPDLIPYA